MRVLIEASGGVASGFMIHALHQAGHDVVASDMSQQNAGSLLADDYIQFLSASDPNLWQDTMRKIQLYAVQVVIPSLDDMLLGWDAQRLQLADMGVELILSPKATLDICLDKWLTYLFFTENHIPTPKTSLSAQYPLFKPRNGRGAKGVFYAPHHSDRPDDMTAMLSQEYLEGDEYTIDVLCNHLGEPVIIVPRRRLLVLNGKAVNAEVVYDETMIDWVRRICCKLHFVGAINIQCFKLADGRIVFIEINPRLASGMALSFAASGNWFDMMIAHQVDKKPITTQPIQWGMKMYRHYTEVFSE